MERGWRRSEAICRPGRRAIRRCASTLRARGSLRRVNSYFDSTAGMTFVRLHGRYRLSFLAKSVAGSTVLHVHVGRLGRGCKRYLDTDVQLPRAWAGFSLEFDANENSLPPAAVETGFSVSGGTVLLDDVEPGADRRRCPRTGQPFATKWWRR